VETMLQAFLFITADALGLHCIPDLDESSWLVLYKQQILLLLLNLLPSEVQFILIANFFLYLYTIFFIVLLLFFF
jgi:hypothetical protein